MIRSSLWLALLMLYSHFCFSEELKPPKLSELPFLKMPPPESYLDKIGSSLDKATVPIANEILIVYEKDSATYPAVAAKEKIEGDCVVQYTKTAKGGVVNPKIVSSNPPGYFESFCLKLVEGYRFKPNIVDGVGIYSPGQRSKIWFKIKGYRKEKLLSIDPPDYPAEPMTKGIEGWVLVKYDINKNGHVENVNIIDEYPKNLFSSAALKAVQSSQYLPRLFEGRPVRVAGQLKEIKFSLDMDVPR